MSSQQQNSSQFTKTSNDPSTPGFASSGRTLTSNGPQTPTTAGAQSNDLWVQGSLRTPVQQQPSTPRPAHRTVNSGTNDWPSSPPGLVSGGGQSTQEAHGSQTERSETPRTPVIGQDSSQGGPGNSEPSSPSALAAARRALKLSGDSRGSR